jgi:hypothetical protein
MLCCAEMGLKADEVGVPGGGVAGGNSVTLPLVFAIKFA